MQRNGLLSLRATTTPMAGFATILFFALTVGADDKPTGIPEGFRGTWILRLTSDDGGKSYKSGDRKAICEVAETEIKFSRKVEFSDEKLIVKTVTKASGRGPATYTIELENGKVWKVSERDGSITAIIHDSEKGKLTETYRFTVRIQPK